jgi:hypothetical protein
MQTPRELWQEQCEAARGVRERFGVKAAFDYIVGEKLQLFAESATRDRSLAADLPWFVAEARKLFTADEIEHHLSRLERELSQQAEFVGDPDDDLAERPEQYQARVETFRKIAELMRAPVLGTS